MEETSLVVHSDTARGFLVDIVHLICMQGNVAWCSDVKTVDRLMIVAFIVGLHYSMQPILVAS